MLRPAQGEVLITKPAFCSVCRGRGGGREAQGGDEAGRHTVVVP